MDDSQLYKDSGQILEHQKQYAEAAAMYIKGDQYERAADMYIKYLIKGDKNKITEAAAIMEKVENDQLNSSFAKACVSCGRYQEAVRAYERANDIDKVSLFFLLLHISLTVYVIHDFPLSFSVLYPFILCPYIYLSVFFLSFSLSLSPFLTHKHTHTHTHTLLQTSISQNRGEQKRGEQKRGEQKRGEQKRREGNRREGNRREGNRREIGRAHV